MFKNLLIIVLTLIFITTACGDPVVELEDEYEPKIAVSAYIYPEKRVENIKVMRNFQLSGDIDSSSIILTPFSNNVNISINDVPLNFDLKTFSYYTDNLQIDYNKEYTIKISAVVDGKQLYTESKTVTPQKGFKVTAKDLGEIKYREVSPTIKFTISPGTGFYAFSINALEAGVNNFIFDNPYEPNVKPEDLEDRLNFYKFQMNMVLNLNLAPNDIYEYEISGLDTWFYGNYEVVVYAGNKNMEDFVLTAGNVQEFDGNFHEPRMYFEGDGIGVFAGAIADTVKFKLVK